MTHVDLDGNTAWEVYANAPQWPYGAQQGPDGGRLIAEYRYTGSFTPPPANGQQPYQTPWAERAEYIYDDGTHDPDPNLTYSLPGSEQTGLGRVAEVQEWTNSGGTETKTDFTHTTYDPVTGQPASIASNEGQVDYAYDPVTGRKVRMWTGADPNNAPDDTAYGYDSQGRLADVYTLVLDNTRYGTYTGIDPATHNPTFTGTPLDVHYTYDLAGNLKTESQPDQTTTTDSYDDENRLTDLSTVNTSTNEPVFAEHYDLRSDGTRQDVIDRRYNADGSLFSKVQISWGYDALDRLASEAESVLDDGTGGTSDANGHAPAAYTNAFKFDLDGNRTEEDISGSQNATVTYTYNGNNELGTETRIGDGAYATNYGYDNAGNLSSQARTGANAESDTYTWDLRGRMATATVGSVQTVYSYDTDGVRTSEGTPGGQTTYYLNDPANPTGYAKAVEELSSVDGNPQDAVLHRSYVLGLQVIGQADESASGPLFLLQDGHGNTRALVDTNAVTIEQYNYDAFGDLLASTGAQSNASLALTPWLQPDGLYDPASGWNYNLARWRDGFRFTSMDDPGLFAPGELADANLSAYVGGNPISHLDPSGELSQLELGLVVALSAGLGAAIVLGGAALLILKQA